MNMEETCIRRADYKVYADFRLRGELAALTPMLFKSQLYIFILMSHHSHSTVFTPEKCSQKNLHANVPNSFIHNCQKLELKCPSAVCRIKELWYIHTMEYYLAIKRNEVLVHRAMRMTQIHYDDSQTVKFYFCDFLERAHVLGWRTDQ